MNASNSSRPPFLRNGGLVLSPGERGFTLMELMTVMIVMAILATLLLGSFQSLQSRAELAKCSANLTSLFTATASYIQDNGMWPQVSTPNANSPEFASDWMSKLTKYGMSQPNWICPTVQRMMRNPDLTKTENARIDYIGSPFDTSSASPFRWSTQPWFIERGSVHGDGNLLIFSNGQVVSMKEFLKTGARTYTQ